MLGLEKGLNTGRSDGVTTTHQRSESSFPVTLPASRFRPTTSHPMLEPISGLPWYAQGGKRGCSTGRLHPAVDNVDLVEDPAENLLVEEPTAETLVVADPHGALSHSNVELSKQSSLLYSLGGSCR